jgi:hypothetical protein
MAQQQQASSNHKAGSTPPPPPAVAASDKTSDKAQVEVDGEKKNRVSRRVYIVEGAIREFKNAAEAEKFLNTDAAAPKEFAVIKGIRVEKKQKVSLR